MFDIITIGGSTYDIFLKIEKNDCYLLKKKKTPEKELLAFDFGGKIGVNEIHECVGGGANNTAVSFSRLGLKTAICSIVGNDKYADIIKKNLKKEKVYTGYLLRSKSVETGFSIILNTYKGERTVLYHRGANNNFSSVSFPAKKIFFNARFLFLNRVSLHGETVLKEIVWMLKRNPSLKLAWNPGGNQLKMGAYKYKEILNRANILFLNKEEAISFSSAEKNLDKINYNNYNQPPFKMIFKKLKKYAPNIIVITDGLNGAYALENRKIYYCPIINTKRVDTLGAGDAFASAFSYAVYKHLNIEKALQYGTANAHSVAGQYGAQAGLLKRKQIENILKKYDLKIKVYNL